MQVSHEHHRVLPLSLCYAWRSSRFLLTRIQLMKDESVEGIITGIQMLADAFYRDPEQESSGMAHHDEDDPILMLEELTGETDRSSESGT